MKFSRKKIVWLVVLAVFCGLAAGVWFGATPKRGSAFSFVGCTVSPGFDFADFEMGDKNTLKAAFPDAVACIGEFG